MKHDFTNNKVIVTKITDSILDSIITEFLLQKLNLVLTPRQKKRGDYDGYEYKLRFKYERNVVGDVIYFHIIPNIPKNIKSNLDIECLSILKILNWMCAENEIEPGEYLIEIVNAIN
jgi:hypothetical protein